MTAETSRKCPVCVDLDDSNMRFNEHEVEDCRLLLISAGAGCPTCKLLKDTVSAFCPEAFGNISAQEFGRRMAEKVAALGGVPQSTTTLLAAVRTEDSIEPTWFKIHRLWDSIYRSGTILYIGAPGASVITIEFFLELDVARKLQFYPVFRASHRLTSTTYSEDRLRAALAWLSDCRASHPLCGTGEPQPLPKRVLDVSFDQIRLYNTGEKPREAAQYVCLNYCWGSGVPFVTTTDTLEKRTTGISMEQLPQTLQDAVAITRRLQIRYLWIDALCIIQDSASDWAEQAGQMAAIYQNAFLTIAAAQSPSTAAGIFNAADPSERALRIPLPTGAHIPVWAREKIPHPELFKQVPNTSATAQLERFPLLSRAWCFQEYLLSPRVLHFGPRELLWTCNEAYRCECFVDEVPGPWGRMENTHFKYKLHNPQSLPGVDLQAQVVAQWHDVVRIYTSLRLTYGADRLPALSGLARFFEQKRRGERYLAGLWKDSLLVDLCWYFGEPGARPEKYQAPTWSWASVDVCAQCTFYPRLFQPMHMLCTLEEALCVPAGKDPTGQVTSGTIVLAGRLVPGVVDAAAAKPGRSNIVLDGEVFMFFLDCEARKCGIFDGCAAFVLPLIDQVDETDARPVRSRYCLILRKSTTEKDTYERIGFQEFTIRESVLRDRDAARNGIWSLERQQDTRIVLV